MSTTSTVAESAPQNTFKKKSSLLLNHYKSFWSVNKISYCAVFAALNVTFKDK